MIALSGCFQPKLAEHLACGPGGACPPDQTCGFDNVCHRAGETIPDAPVTPQDGVLALLDALPDAAPVGCQNDNDCATPPGACSQPGTCVMHVCNFPPVSCTQLDSECAVGMCEPMTGTCVAMPRNENGACNGGTTCGAFGVCSGFSDACDETGTQSRACTVSTCHAGTCVGTPMTDSAACTRPSQDGAACGTATQNSCSACTGFSTFCDETGTQSCTCVQPRCLGGSCSSSSSSGCNVGCSRVTDGLSCGPNDICDSGSCNSTL